MSWPARSALPRRRFHSGNRRCVTVQYSNGFLSSARFSANTAPRQASTIAITCAHWISCKDVGMKFHWGGFLVKLLNVDLMSHPFAFVQYFDDNPNRGAAFYEFSHLSSLYHTVHTPQVPQQYWIKVVMYEKSSSGHRSSTNPMKDRFGVENPLLFNCFVSGLW